MVPITFLAFLWATLYIENEKPYFVLERYDVFGLIITGFGVMLFNLYKEKPQKVCIEDDSPIDVNMN